MLIKRYSTNRLLGRNVKLWWWITGVSLLLIGAIGLSIHQGQTARAAAPVVTDISPNNGPIAGGTVITVTGSGFKGLYERVEALVFDGSSYIDTGVSQMSHNINVRFKMDTSNVSSVNMVFGNGNSSGSQMMGFGRAAGGASNATNLFTAYMGNSSDNAGSARINVGGNNDLTLNWTRIYNVNGSQIAAFGTVPTTAANIWIGGSASPASYYRGMFYRLRTYSGNAVDHDFMPVKKISNGEYGVVDMVTKQFYGNSGGGTISGGTTINGTFTLGAVIPGGLSPDSPTQVLIDNRPCTGVNIVSDAELTCHTPSGLSLGRKNVTVYVDNVNQTTVVNGFEYALRLNSIYPKFGPTTGGNTIEIDGGVFSTPPEQYESVEGIVFDGTSWIETGFNQVGSTKMVIKFQNKNGSLLPASGNIGFFGARNASSGSSFVVWHGVGGTNMRTDYNASTGGNYALSNMPYPNIYSIVKDNNTTNIYNSDGSLKYNFPATGSGIIDDSTPVEMLLGSLSHGGAYGTNGATAYGSFQGVIYSAQICKDHTNSVAVPVGTVYQQDDALCGSGRRLVRDFRPAVRDTDNAYGFYDMVTGEFFANAGFGTFTPSGSTLVNELEVPLVLNVTVGGRTCTNPQLVSPTRISCVVPASNLPGNGEGKVKVQVFANGVQATPGSNDADDYYYGTPMVVDTIAPNRGPIAGGQVVTITGSNFFRTNTANASGYWQNYTVTVGGSACNIANAGAITNTTITCTTTSNSGGISDIFVDNGESDYLYGGSIDPITGAITSGYLYEDNLVSVAPNSGPTTGGTNVTIVGNHFLTAGTTTQVYFDNVAATNVLVVNSTTITARTPAHAPGAVDVLVVQNGYAATLSRLALGAFTYYFSGGSGSLSPNKGYTAGGDSIVITGSGFDPNTAATVTFDGVAATNVTVLDGTRISLTTPAHAAGLVDVIITQYGVPITIYNAFEYIPPLTISSTTPNRGASSGGTIVTIAGVSFIPAGETAASAFSNLTVLFGGVPCVVASAAYFSNTFITCTTGAHATGLVNVTVTSGAGANHTDTSYGAFHPSTGALLGGYFYADISLSLSANSVSMNLSPPDFRTGNTTVLVTTNNSLGYTLAIKADDGNASTNNDNWLKCTRIGSTAKFESIASAGAITDNTWGWAVGSSTPPSWLPMPTSNTNMMSPIAHPTGPLQDGALPDSYTLWFGARANPSQEACSYTTTIVLTVVANV